MRYKHLERANGTVKSECPAFLERAAMSLELGFWNKTPTFKMTTSPSLARSRVAPSSLPFSLSSNYLPYKASQRKPPPWPPIALAADARPTNTKSAPNKTSSYWSDNDDNLHKHNSLRNKGQSHNAGPTKCNLINHVWTRIGINAGPVLGASVNSLAVPPLLRNH